MWTMLKDIRANSCVSLLCTQTHAPHHASSARWVVKWAMIRQMAIGIVLPGFNNLGRLVTPIFLLMDQFLYWFSMFREKMKKIYQLEIWMLCKIHHPIPFFLALHLSVRQFQMPLEGLSFMKTLATFGIIYTTDSLIQNITRIVCLHWFIFDILS